MKMAVINGAIMIDIAITAIGLVFRMHASCYIYLIDRSQFQNSNALSITFHHNLLHHHLLRFIDINRAEFDEIDSFPQPCITQQPVIVPCS